MRQPGTSIVNNSMVIKVQGSGERLLNESQTGYDRPATIGISNFCFLISDQGPTLGCDKIP